MGTSSAEMGGVRREDGGGSDLLALEELPNLRKNRLVLRIVFENEDDCTKISSQAIHPRVQNAPLLTRRLGCSPTGSSSSGCPPTACRLQVSLTRQILFALVMRTGTPSPPRWGCRRGRRN